MNTNYFLALFLLIFSLNAFAEEAPFVAYETDRLKIKLSNDGTGVVQDVGCSGCDFKVVKITSKSRATINGKEVSIFEARKRAGKEAMVSFNPETREVQYIRWSE
ncbi:MAG: hypothetical protein ACC650_00470 [Gammaproteobacteria bacterium]